MSKNHRLWPLLSFRHSREKADTDTDPTGLIASHGHDTRSETPDDHLQTSHSRRRRSISWLRISNRNKNKDAETKPTKLDQEGANTQPYLSQTEYKDEPDTSEGKVSGSAESIMSAQGTPIKEEEGGQAEANIARLGEKVMKDLWSEAYKKLHSDNASLVESYETVLLAPETDHMGGRSSTTQEKTDRQKRIQDLVFCRLQDMEQGRFDIPKRSRQGVIGDYVRRTVHGILYAKDFVTAAISAEPHAALAWAGVVMVLPLFLKPFTQREDAVAGLQFISDLLIRYHIIQNSHVEIFMDVLGKSTPEDISKFGLRLRERTINLYSQVLEYQIRLTKQLSRSGLFQYMRDIATADDWKEMLTEIKRTDKSIEDILGDWSKKTVQEIHAEITSMKREVERQLNIVLDTINTQAAQDQLDILHPVTRAAFGSYEQARETCLVGTQVPLLQLIQDWSNDAQGEPILWLQGMAGTGKSTIARTVASAFYNGTSLLGQETLPNDACLGGSFFFDHRDEDCRDPRKLFPTLARNLVDVPPEIQQSLCDGIRSHHATHAGSLDGQWKHLIFNPLKMLKTTLPVTILFVLDALDECQAGTREDQDDISDILALLSQVRELTTVRVRVLITSRPGIHMRYRFNEIPEGIRDETVYKIRRLDGDGVKADDITRLIEYKLSEVRRRNDLPRDWPGKERVDKLAEKADGLFIYAATVCRFLAMANRKTIEDRLGKIFDGDVGLDGMYTRILQVVLTGEVDNDQAMSDLFKQVVGSIIVLSRPLSIRALSRLVEVELSDTRWLMEHLYSVLEMPQGDHGPIQLLHLSFRDFLLASQRCNDNRFWIDEKQAHRNLYQYCLKIMSNILRRNICCLEDPDTHIADMKPSVVHEFLPEQVQYACSHWVDHLQRSDIVASDDTVLYDFLRTHFVHWLEAMAVMGRIPIAIMILNNLTTLQLETNAKLRRLVHDARRFAVSFRSVYEKAPLQIYASALLFAPQESIIRREFEEEIPAWISEKPSAHQYWSPLLHTIPKPSRDPITQLKFSPDSRLMAVVSSYMYSHVCRLWDTSTWVCVKSFEDQGNIRDAAFSPDSKQLATVSEAGSVRLWNTHTGRSTFLESASSAVTFVVFSSNGEKLAAKSHGEIKAWDLVSERLLLEIPDERSEIVSISPDCRFIASWNNLAVIVWDVSQRAVLHTHERRGVHTIEFSPEGNLLIASNDGTVELWDCTENILRSYTNIGYKSLVAGFSPDSKNIVSLSTNGQINVWDWTTNEFKSNIHHISDSVDYSLYCGKVSFPRFGELAASLVADGPEDIWTFIPGVLTEIYRFSGRMMDALAFSPDGEIIAASACWTEEITIWNGSSKVSEALGDIHEDTITGLSFAPNGTVVASAAKDGTIRFWEAQSGTHMKCLRGVDDPEFQKIRFSTDSQTMICRTYNGQCVIWNIPTWKVLKRLELGKDTSKLQNMALSHDGQLVATGCFDERKDTSHIELWNLTSTEPLLALTEEGDTKDNEISPLGSFIASTYYGSSSFQLRHTQTGNLIHSMDHGDRGPVIAFSPSESMIASAEHSIKLWDTSTGTCLGQRSIDGCVESMVFSEDGTYLRTNEGQFQVASILGANPDLCHDKMVGEGVYVHNNWIMEGGKKLIHLPVEYRFRTCSFGSRVAIASKSSSVMVIGLSADERKTV
ncbi:WD40 repeat protein [Aspergillus oryzae 3.042]|uniref:Mitochondrial division protein 1 n=2 Tax=Aspergillus subgen. Circumdati TaxID=2720871 RepID=I8TLH1_ASPO3|nr:WD40 repeat protein [Aspergillus oryzae 3.042]|eukprot:EIT74723.1 WD40 repeat protein [Aspergillus oryzae 3.042]